MRLERLTPNKIRIFLTFDDLDERGLSKEDLWTDVPKVQELLQDMMDEAVEELGFVFSGPLAVEVFALKAQGMVVIVSKENSHHEEDYSDDFIEMQVTVDECNDYLFLFHNIEDCIALANRLSRYGMREGSLYCYNNLYYILFQEDEISIDVDMFISIVVEYGNSSNITTYKLKEYGKLLMNENAIRSLCYYFK